MEFQKSSCPNLHMCFDRGYLLPVDILKQQNSVEICSYDRPALKSHLRHLFLFLARHLNFPGLYFLICNMYPSQILRLNYASNSSQQILLPKLPTSQAHHNQEPPLELYDLNNRLQVKGSTQGVLDIDPLFFPKFLPSIPQHPQMFVEQLHSAQAAGGRRNHSSGAMEADLFG